jgi:hypothetical protein
MGIFEQRALNQYYVNQKVRRLYRYSNTRQGWRVETILAQIIAHHVEFTRSAHTAA